MNEVEFIAVTHASGMVSRLQIVVGAAESRFHPEAAARHGFELANGRWKRKLTDDMIEAEVTRSVFHDEAGAVVSWRRVKAADFPDDAGGAYKAARRDNVGKIEIHMPAARDIHRGNLRRLRQPKLDELDRLWHRANGSKRQKEADDIEDRRQALRDVTKDPAIEAAQTPEELKAVIPAVLRDGIP